MKKILDYIKANKYCLLLIYWPIHFITYGLFGKIFAEQDVWLLYSPLDDKIPFCEWFIFPYVFWYFWIAFMLIYSLYHGKREFIRTDMLLTLCMAIPMIFCIFVPNGIDISMRPDFNTLGRENIGTKLVQLIYAADSPPRNCMPSMHVTVAWALMFSTFQLRPFAKRYFIKALSFVMCMLISLATVFIKQHSILDVFAGVGVGIAVFFIVFIAEKIYDKKKAVK